MVVAHVVGARLRPGRPAPRARRRPGGCALRRRDEGVRSGRVRDTGVQGNLHGALKTLVDLIPLDALAGRPALGSRLRDRRRMASRRTFRCAPSSPLQGPRPRPTLVVLDDEIEGAGLEFTLSAAAAARVRASALALISALDGSKSVTA